MDEKDPHDLAARYAVMSERELMALARKYDDLGPAAQAALRAEFSKRSLEPPLLDERDEMELAQIEVVTLRRYRDLPEAVVARSVLEGAGIRCFLRDENVVRMDWTLSNAIGGLRLQVAREDAAAANEILDRPIPESFFTDIEEEFQQPVCPRCGSLKVVANDTDRKIALASTIGGGLLLPVGLPALALQQKGIWKCDACGCKWVEEDGEESMAPGQEHGLR